MAITIPRYPDILVSANVEGTLTARVPVSRDGAAGRAGFDSLDIVHQILAFSLRNALLSARFAPATRLGIPNDAQRQWISSISSYAVTRSALWFLFRTDRDPTRHPDAPACDIKSWVTSRLFERLAEATGVTSHRSTL